MVSMFLMIIMIVIMLPVQCYSIVYWLCCWFLAPRGPHLGAAFLHSGPLVSSPLLLLLVLLVVRLVFVQASLLLRLAGGPLCYSIWQLLLQLPGCLLGLPGGGTCSVPDGEAPRLGGPPTSYEGITPGASFRAEAEIRHETGRGGAPYRVVLQHLLLLLEEYLDGRWCCCIPSSGAAAVAAAAAAADAAFASIPTAAGGLQPRHGPPAGASRRAKRPRVPSAVPEGPQQPAAAGPRLATFGGPREESALFIEVLLPFVLKHQCLQQRFMGALWGRLMALIRGLCTSTGTPGEPFQLGWPQRTQGAPRGKARARGRGAPRTWRPSTAAQRIAPAEREAAPQQSCSSTSSSSSSSSRESSNDSTSDSSCWKSRGAPKARSSVARGPSRGPAITSQAPPTAVAAATTAKATFESVLAGPLGATSGEGWSLAAMTAALEVGGLLRSVAGGRRTLGLEGPSEAGPSAAPGAPKSVTSSNRKRQRQQQQEQQQLLLLPQQLLLQGIEGYFRGLLGVLHRWGPFRRPAHALQQLVGGPQGGPLSELLPLPLCLFLGPHREHLLLRQQQQQQQQQLYMRALAAQRGLLRLSLSFFLGLAHLATAYGCLNASGTVNPKLLM